jgi:hypothetical protein
MSIPSCIRPQRHPNGLTTGPDTGQISPLDDTTPEDVEAAPDWGVAELCAEAIAAASWALCRESCSASSAYPRSSASSSCSATRFCERDSYSASWFETSS